MTGFEEIDGIKIRYKRGGKGPPVLLLHGWGGSIESLDPVHNALVNHFDSTSIDFPGHGQSSMPPRAWTVSDFLDLTLKFMDRSGLARANIVAHSFGGRVTIKLAAQFPDRAGKLLFVAGAGVKPPLSLKRKLKRAASRLKVVTPAPLRRILAPYLSSSDYASAGELRPTLRNVIEEDLSEYLPKIRSQCLLVWGDQDHETPLYCGQTMARRIPANEFIVFPGAGHFPYLDEMNKFNLLAMKFFREDE